MYLIKISLNFKITVLVGKKYMNFTHDNNIKSKCGNVYVEHIEKQKLIKRLF